MGRTDEARVVKAKADMKALEQGLNLYRLDSGVYPTTEQGLAALVEEPRTGEPPRNWRPDGYMERVPLDPWNREFLYASDGRTYTLQSLGADGQEGGEGFDADLDTRDF
jgi:general secretion pathway protein G